MPVATQEIRDWRLIGDWWDLCNCAVGCPCNFGSDPTLGYCEGVLTWLIRDGNYGELKFSKNLAVVLIIHWQGNVFEKNREFGFLIDDRADAQERVAPRRRRIRENDCHPRRRKLAGRSAGHGRWSRWAISQIHGAGERHLPHLQCAAAGGRPRFSHGRTGPA